MDSNGDAKWTGHMIRIVNWSGGPDSTYMLVDLLENTDDQIIAHFIKTEAWNPYSHIARHRSVKRLLPHLRPLREFEYRETTLYTEPYMKKPFNENHAFANMMIAHMLRDQDVTVNLGRCRYDADLEWSAKQQRIGIRVPSEIDEFVRLVSMFATFEFRGFDIDKSTIRNKLGNLWDMTTSCEFHNSQLNPCNECIKCEERKHAEA